MRAAQTGIGEAIAVEVIQSKEEIVTFVQELMNDIQANYIAERRADPRCPVSISMEAIPFDSQGQQAGEPFTAVTKDVSAGGISFMHNAAILDWFLLVRFPRSNRHESRRIVLEVFRRRQVGPLWEITGRFIAKPKGIKSRASSRKDAAGDS